jgi:hypothetical protein
MMNQYIFYCDSVAPQTITLSFTNTVIGSLVTPPGWTPGAPRPSNPPPVSPAPTSSVSVSPPQVTMSSHTAKPSSASTTKTLSSGVIAAISLAAVAIVAVTSAMIFWFCIRPWLKNRGLQTSQPLPEDTAHDDSNYPWGPDSLAAKPPDRQSIPYPASHSELPAHSPHLVGDDKKQSDIGSDVDSGIEPIEDSYSQGTSRGEISPLSSPQTHSLISRTPSGNIDRTGAVSPISIAATDGTGRRQRFGFLTPEGAMTGYVEEDDDEGDEGFRMELEGSPSFHTRGSMRRKRESTPKELDSKRNSMPKELDSKRYSMPKELDSNRNSTLKELDSNRGSILEERSPTPEEKPEETPEEEVPKGEALKEEVPKEEVLEEGAPKEEMPEETPKEEVSNEVPKRAPEEVPEETLEETLEEVSKEAPEAETKKEE